MVKGVEGAKVACLDINLHKVKLALGISVRGEARRLHWGALVVLWAIE